MCSIYIIIIIIIIIYYNSCFAPEYKLGLYSIVCWY